MDFVCKDIKEFTNDIYFKVKYRLINVYEFIRNE